MIVEKLMSASMREESQYLKMVDVKLVIVVNLTYTATILIFSKC